MVRSAKFPNTFLREPLHGSAQAAAFGKHPAWDDHIDDIGLRTESLVLTKKLLYSQGIASQLASGAWDQIEKQGNTLEFNHRFCWCRKGQTIVGGIWASSDRKGRTRFPMVVCGQLELDAWKVLGQVNWLLDEAGNESKSAKSPDEFRKVLARFEAQLYSALASPSGALSALDLQESGQNLTLASMVTLGAGLKFRLARSTQEANRAMGCHFRVITEEWPPAEKLAFWSAYVSALELPANPPILTIAPIGKRWIDFIAGEPVDADFFCLRANLTALPETRFEIMDSDRRHLQPVAERFLHAAKSGAGTPPAPGIVDPGEHRSWWKSLFKH